MTTEPVSGGSRSEEVFYNWHYQASTLCLRHTSSTFRSFLEFWFMLMAVSGFAALICLHHAFVYRGHPPTNTALNINGHQSLRSTIPLTCLPSIPGFRRDADATHLVLLPSHERSFAYEVGIESSNITTSEETRVCSEAKGPSTCSSNYYPTEELIRSFTEVYFSYSHVKGYAYLTPKFSCNSPPYTDTRGVSTQIVAISKSDTRCFGEPFLQHAVFHLLGPDVVMMNWLLAISDGTGYIYNPRTDIMLDLRQYHITNTRNFKSRGFNLSASTILDMSNWSSWFRPWATKFATALKTCLIYFISTNIVSFLLRVAQERLLELSLQIKSHQQAGRSILPLFVTHVADSFIFLPITAGVVFFLREFYQGDWKMALMVLTVLWFCEAYSFISVRSVQGVHFFPRAIFLLFALVHFYLFSFPFGFSYVAMGMIVCFMTQCCLFFWNRYELPAVVLGLVDHPTRVDYLSSAGENGLITATHNILRHRLVTDESTIPAVASLSLSHSPTRDFQENGRPTSPNETPQHRNANLQHQPQSQRALHPTSSHGNFSVGRMSRASSEAIFRLAADGDDESESCMYFLGGEVVLRRGDSRGNRQGNSGSGSTNESFHLNRYDSASTIHSTGGLGTVADETEDSRSGLQAIHDLTPRLCNTYRTDSFEESPPAASSVPVFPVLAENDSTPPTRVLQRQSRTT